MVKGPIKKFTDNSPDSFNLVIETETGRVAAWAYWVRYAGEKNRDKVDECRRKLEHDQHEHTTTTNHQRFSNGDYMAPANGITFLHRRPTASDANKGLSPSASVGRARLDGDCAMKDRLEYFTEDHWYLSLLFVHPEQKRRGYGSILTLWGMDKARAEGLPAYLTASPEGEMLYSKLGWQRVGRRTMPKFEDLSKQEQAAELQDFGESRVKREWGARRGHVMKWYA